MVLLKFMVLGISKKIISFCGVSLSRFSKQPSKPDGRTHQAELFFENRDASSSTAIEKHIPLSLLSPNQDKF
ncbi:uncharacterized protein VP01_4137g1 [Puccinia sorghi]|uniref:Uncharacterized protein n=1 Tax=Puccinia sorghi TaxID=27349 RepID=A0A0L6UR45_9BASI|nr:uncharacterized protein VP01_4137g1 [Puccinia sorghi]